MTLLCFQWLFFVYDIVCVNTWSIAFALSHDSLADDTHERKLGFDMLQVLYLPCQQNERCRK